MLPSGAAVGSRPTVEPDDALQVFDPATRRLLDRGTRALARGLRAPNAGDEINATISGLDQVLSSIRQLTGSLHGQEQSISTFVTSSAAALDAIASRQRQLQHLIGSGRVVAQTFAAESGALGRGIDQLNRLLAEAQRVLPRLRPFLADATPTLNHAAATADGLLPAVEALAPALAYARKTGLELDPSARAAVPTFINAIAAERWLRPLSRGLIPTVANLVPLMSYIHSQIRGWESFIANTSDALDHGDSVGPWLQGFLALPPGGLLGSTTPCSALLGLCSNPYPKPGDASNPQPYVKGDFPRLLPYYPKGSGG
jgi:hypothetical protein